jgi:hypothetical protein
MARATGPSKTALAALMREAHRAGMAAGRGSTPPTMIVRQHADPMNDRSPVDRAWVVPDGPCGFAWVTIRPAHSRAAKVMAGLFDGTFGGNAGHNSYSGGMQLSIWEFNQSMVRKEAYAHAFARHLTDAGIAGVYTGSRMD